MSHEEGRTAPAASAPLMYRKGARENVMLSTCLIAFFLGALCMGSVGLMAHAYVYTRCVAEFALGVYVLTVHVAFHLTEFVLSAAQRPHNCHPAAFMLFHSTAYTVASVSAIAEFLIEALFIPESWKGQSRVWWWLGLRLSFTSVSCFAVLTAFFYGIRVAAMAQCGANFSLMIEDERREDHVLVDTGLYRHLRHPAYFGWFWRTVCAQFILANPISAVLHTAVTWLFFRRRIPYEESTLEKDDYFGAQYRAYKKRTIVGIPFIAGAEG